MSEPAPSMDQALLRALLTGLDSLGTGVIAGDIPSRHITRVNDAACSMVGYTREELMKLDFTELVHPSSQAQFQTMIQARLAGALKPSTTMLTLRHKDGHAVEIDLVTVVVDAKQVLVVGLMMPHAAQGFGSQAFKAPPHSGTVPEHPKTVLVADDEEGVRLVIAKVLERQGFRVLTAADGQQAKDVYDRHRDDISLCVLDLSMPQKGGRDVLEHIRRHSRSARILLVSGYHEDELPQDLEPSHVWFLRKPFLPDALREKVRVMLAD